MSLEQALSENTSAINALIAQLKSGNAFTAGMSTPVAAPVTIAPAWAATEQPTKVEKEEAAKKPETPKSKPTSDTSPASSPESTAPTKPEVDFDAVKQAVLEVSKKSRGTPQDSREQAEALLQRFGVQKISQLGIAVYADVYALAQKVMAGEDASEAVLPEGAEGLE
jgi:hypothetical protein